MKILQSVHYLLFFYEPDNFEEKDGDYVYHHLDGGVRLTFRNQTALHFSWINRPVTYSIGWSSKSHWKKGTLAPYDMSESVFWKPFIGQPISFEHLDEAHQVVKISCLNTHLFLSSQYEDGMFMGDCVRISPTHPDVVSSAESD